MCHPPRPTQSDGLWSVSWIESDRFEDDHLMCPNENVEMSIVEKVLPLGVWDRKWNTKTGSKPSLL